MWLVKSGGVVTGPFAFEELIAKIEAKEVVAHDEVAAPLSRWHYVREQPELAFAVDRIRDQSGRERDDTMTGSRTEDVGIMDADFDDHDFPEENLAPSASAPLKTYGQTSDVEFQEQVKASGQRVWIILSMVLLGAAFLVWQKRKPPPKSIEELLTHQELVEVAQKAWRMGDYSRAAEHLSRAQGFMPGDTEVNLLLSTLLIAQEGQTVEARRILQKISPDHLSPQQQTRWRTILGLASIVDNDLEDALSQIQSAQRLDPTFEPVLLNLGTIYHLRGQYEQAQKAFKEVSPVAASAQFVKLLSLRSQLDSLVANQGGKTQLTDIGKQLMGLGRDTSDYKQEAFFLAAHAFAAAGDNDSAQLAAEQALDVDPLLTEAHWHDPLISRRLLDWADLMQLCPRIVGINPNLARMRAFSGFCKAKVNRWVDARKDFEQALTLNDRDPLVRAVFAVFLMINAREQEAGATLIVSENERFNLPLIVAARLCPFQQEPECAQKNWQQLLTINSKSLPALAGLAKLNMRNEQQQARAELDKGLELSPNYIPFLKLKHELAGVTD